MQRIHGRKVDIYAWTQPSEIEGTALEQLKNISSLPWVFHHVAAMPDVHYGKGATVGSVIAMKGAVSPAAVGVDIGCFTGDTRVPLADGKDYAIADLVGRDLVVYACTPSGRVVMTAATARKTRTNASLLRVTLDNGEQSRCTPDHQFMLRDGSYARADSLSAGASLMPLYKTRDKDGYTLVQQNYSGRMQKAHWIAARSGLLGKVPRFAGQRTIIHHRNFDESDNSPSNLEFMGANDHAALHRSIGERNEHWQSEEFEARRVAALAQKARTPEGHAFYSARYNHKVVSVEALAEREDVYCLAVPEYGNFALSAGVFVHNCGMAAVRTSLEAKDLPDGLHGLRSALERAIPVGFSEHRDPLDRPQDKPLWDEFRDLTPAVKDLLHKARRQVGTLGGGNHFIELCLDTEDRVWMMLHSGSRNIGKSLADVHIARAKKLAHNQDLPDRDLAVFLAGTPEMEQYRRDLFWAQRYAMKNREAMLDLYARVLRESFAAVEFAEPVLCHHNYVAEETHFGEEVLVTRKGAIRAGKGDLGIIPGSMGTRSYIVRGLGNAQSFESASHGAGRKMSRGEAKRRFKVEDLQAQTQGVECRKDQGVLDEIPAAYKPIERVMENQRDLVEIVAELRQVLCVKG